MTKNNEIEKKLKRVQWIRTVINHHLNDVEKILKDAMSICPQPTPNYDELPKYAKWPTYCDVFDSISIEKDAPMVFTGKVGKLLYAMSKNGISRDEAKGVVDKLIPKMSHKDSVDSIKECLSFLYSKKQPSKPMTSTPCEVDDHDLFGGDLGMP